MNAYPLTRALLDFGHSTTACCGRVSPPNR